MILWKSAGLFLLSGILCITTVSPVYATELQDAKDQAKAMETEKKALEGTLKDLERLKSDAAAYVQRLDESLSILEDEISEVEVKISEKEIEILEIKSQLADAKMDEEKQYESMKLRIRYLYERGQMDQVEILLTASSFTQFLNRVEYIRKISEYDRKMLDRYIETKKTVEATEVTLLNEYEELSEFRQSSYAKRSSLNLLSEKKTGELRVYQSQIADAQTSLTEMQKDIAQQESKIKKIEDEIKRQEEQAKKAAQESGQVYNTVSIGNIKFIWPCPSSRRITSGFGARKAPLDGASSNHQGIDVGAATGTEIVAAAAGTVTISTYSASAGNYIVINHGGGVSTVYMHCSQLLASQGQQVSQGQVIAKVGSTGYSTGPHLHFGVRIDGVYVNPSKYVSP